MGEKEIKNIGVFNDNDIPYEVRMKYLIEGYRRDLKRLDQLSRYAKGLEEENQMLQEKVKEYPGMEYHKQQIKQLTIEVNQLKGTLTKVFPKRVITLSQIRQKVVDLGVYISYLQSLLRDNGIAYDERKPNPLTEVERIRPENIDIFAIRGKNENFGQANDAFCYKYPRPAVTADCIVMTNEPKPKVLLIQRGAKPFKGCWAFPGGFMDMDETAEQCAIRELFEETGLKVSYVRQVGAYSKVDRDPRGRTITVAFLAILDEAVQVTGQDDAAKAQWFDMSDMPQLAFDHAQIMADAVKVYNEVVNRYTHF